MVVGVLRRTVGMFQDKLREEDSLGERGNISETPSSTNEANKNQFSAEQDERIETEHHGSKSLLDVNTL